MPFNLSSIDRSEFYVCLTEGNEEKHYQIPIDLEVQNALGEMFIETLLRIRKLQEDEGIEDFSPSQKYGATDAVSCPMDSEFCEAPRHLLEENNIPETKHALDDLIKISYYYAILWDDTGEKALGVRRASQFKGILKSKLLTIVDNSLHLLQDNAFKLDSNFDYIVFDDILWALRPAGLEFTAKLTDAVKAAAPQAAADVATRMSFLNLNKLGEYAAKHPRAARYLAAVRSRNDLELISQDLLIKYCENTNIELQTEEGKISPSTGHELHFLEVLDRRIFTAELIKGEKERYEAPNRRTI
ncbi:MAG: DUF4868 domain-containing protein [Verrucomicrobiota bacterium]